MKKNEKWVDVINDVDWMAKFYRNCKVHLQIHPQGFCILIFKLGRFILINSLGIS